MLVRDQLSDDSLIISDRSSWAKLNVKLKIAEKLMRYHQSSIIVHQHSISSEWLPDRLASRVQQINPDIINLHWTCKGFLKIETLAKFTQPIVWTLHDMWAFTGGCHYSESCDLYTKSCGSCPQLQSNREQDLSRWVWNRKAKSWKSLNLTIVSPSNWLAECARSSFLFQNNRVEVIPNGLDTQIYQPIERHLARARLKLPQDKLLILFGAMSSTSDRRKGFHLLQSALQKLGESDWRNQVELVVFGSFST
jgi:glycosyltransferase involved in cell wall biosynthesis